ncbi:hypothetical protein AVEN_22026-1 [Araneus ventricosus]|uniref:Uncharacterized protein n=1 Tax=Araneus ventricosus TaxID=182803 RepID=A0A4Y2J1C4_ARAVE|nr:hypothetical protein AVEN_22026-1 [Araneus ventricosus]
MVPLSLKDALDIYSISKLRLNDDDRNEDLRNKIYVQVETTNKLDFHLKILPHRGGFSNQKDDIDSDDEDVILANLKRKWKTVEGNGRITDDATLSDILEVDAELLTASYPTAAEI